MTDYSILRVFNGAKRASYRADNVNNRANGVARL